MTGFLIQAARIVGLAVGLFACGLWAAEKNVHPTIRWQHTPGDATRMLVEVTNVPMPSLRLLARADWTLTQWQQLFPVYAEQGSVIADMELPPMSGQYRVVNGTVRFEPPFSLEPGVRYRAVFRAMALPGNPGIAPSSVSATHQLPARPTAATTEVTQIYPTPAVLPENLLKFYLQFSAPMSRGHIYDYIRLKNAAGQPVELPFLEIDEELWNPAMTRLTLFLDPGRIKRGVRPLEEIGPALVVGQSYSLFIDRAWPDAEGNPLKTGFAKRFQVGPPDREPPDPKAWRLRSPGAGTRDPLILHFNEPLDHAVIQRVARVTDGDGNPVSGTVSVGDEERSWTLMPHQPWKSGQHQVTIPTAIEDLAGNNIGRAFEVDLTANPPPRLTNSVVQIPFLVL